MNFPQLGPDILSELIKMSQYLTIKNLCQCSKDIDQWRKSERFKLMIEEKRIQHLSQRLQLYIFDFFPRYTLTIRILSHRYIFAINKGKFSVTHNYKEETNNCTKSTDENINNPEYLKCFIQRNILNINTVSLEVTELIKNIILNNYCEFGDNFLCYCWFPENQHNCDIYLDWEKVIKCYR